MWVCVAGVGLVSESVFDVGWVVCREILVGAATGTGAESGSGSDTDADAGGKCV